MDISYFSDLFTSLYSLISAFVISDYFAFIAVFILMIFLINAFMGLFSC